MSENKMLTIAEVLNLRAGDKNSASWISPGCQGVIRRIEQKDKDGTKRWQCEVGSTTGPASVEMTIFTAPKFKEGDVIEISGKGIRRTEYSGRAQINTGKETQIQVIGSSAHHEEQHERQATSEPSINGQSFTVPGQTVGMAIKEAIDIVPCVDGQGNAIYRDPAFWADIYNCASDIIRLARLLESGKLAPAIKVRTGSANVPPQPIRPTGAAIPYKQTQQVIEDQDVPF